MNGQKIAILESRLGRQLVDLVARRGGAPIHVPALAETPCVEPEFIKRLVADLEARPAKLVIFQTGVGTQALFQATDELGLSDALLRALAKAIVAVRGPKPSGPLRARGVRIDRSAAEPFTTAEVLAALEGLDLAGARVLVQRHGGANPELDAALRAKGAEIVEIPTYRWALPADTAPLLALMDALEAGQVDAVAVTSAAQIGNLFQLAEGLGRADKLRASLNRTRVASIGPVASAALKKLGVAVTLEASPPKLGPFVAALDAAFQG